MPDPVVTAVNATVIDVLVTFDQTITVVGQPVESGFTVTVNGDPRSIISATHDGDKVRLFVSTIVPDDVVSVTFDNTTPYIFDETGLLPATGFTQVAVNGAEPFYAAVRIYGPEIEFLDGYALPRVEIELSRAVRQLVRRFGKPPIDPQVAYSSAIGSLTVGGTPSNVGGGTAVTAKVTSADPVLTGAAAQAWQDEIVDRVTRAFAQLVLTGEAVGAVINPSQTLSL